MHNRELERLTAVDRFLKLKISKDNELNEIAQYAARLCDTTIAVIALIDDQKQYITVSAGLEQATLALNTISGAYLTSHNGLIILNYAATDEKFVSHFLAHTDLNLQFYAAIPLLTQDGLKMGSLSVMGNKPADLSDLQILMLGTLGRQAVHILEFDYSLRIMKEQFLEAKKNEITLRSVFESSRSCHILIDFDLKILFYNKVISDVAKTLFDQTIKGGVTITDILDDSLLLDFLKNFNLAKNGQRISHECLLNHQLGPSWWRITFNPAFDSEGKIIGVYGTATDITDVTVSTSALAERDKQLHSIALIQSHELRRPVASILGLMNLFKQNEYQVDPEEFMMLERAALELDNRIHEIVNHVSGSQLSQNENQS